MKKVARLFAGPVMLVAGLNHFVSPEWYVNMVPAALPAPEALVYLSGAAEALGALGTMHPRTRRPAGWFLIATLVAVYPANVYMALNPDEFSSLPQWGLWARLPLQFLFIYWVWLATLHEDKSPLGARRA